jgi:hypothetical protein
MTIAPVDGDADVIDRHAMALDLGPHTLSRGTGDRLQLHYTVAVLAERHPDTKVQTTKMTTASTADLIQHNRPAAAAGDSGAGGDAPTTGRAPTPAGVPAGTPRGPASACSRGARKGSEGASRPPA